MNHELAKTLTTALVQFIDRERPEGSMCCSSYECEKVEKAFEGGTYDVVEKLIKQKLSRLTEFQNAVRVMITEALTTHIKDGNGREMSSTVFIDDDTAILLSAGLLELAKKELLSYADESNPAIEAMADLERNFKCDPAKLPGWLIEELNKAFKRGQEASHEDYIRGYTNGYKDAEEKYNEQTSYHFPPITVRPLCYEPGGTCTNPHFDCINCPKKTTGGIFTSPNTNTNTASGTSAGTLHGNTSATDGKPHNPSFTD